MSNSLSIPRTLANKLLTLAQQAPENEICGLVSVTESNKYQLYPVDNIADNSACVFEMDPQQQVAAFKNMREKNEALFAIFHSHPHSDAIPSKKDINESAYAEALNIIISLNTTGVLDMRGYFYKDKSVENVDLVIE